VITDLDFWVKVVVTVYTKILLPNILRVLLPKGVGGVWGGWWGGGGGGLGGGCVRVLQASLKLAQCDPPRQRSAGPSTGRP
jgi:hypothetical protein